jgi:hypothetical protein
MKLIFRERVRIYMVISHDLGGLQFGLLLEDHCEQDETVAKCPARYSV